MRFHQFASDKPPVLHPAPGDAERWALTPLGLAFVTAPPAPPRPPGTRRSTTKDRAWRE